MVCIRIKIEKLYDIAVCVCVFTIYYKILYSGSRRAHLYKSNICRLAERNDLPTCCVVLAVVEFALLNGRQ